MVDISSVCGVVFLDKPIGWTSRQAVNAVVRQFTPAGRKRIKAGHGGTLDPLATGMLPILLGEATRYADYGLSAEKAYTVSFDLSYLTDTLDKEGEICARFERVIEEQELQAVLGKFTGRIEQVPPAYSAIRVDGKRAHESARSGQSVELPARPVEILELSLLHFDFPVVTLHVRCSKGTYIRSLARDIGAALDMGGCVTALRRTSTGGWPESMMVTLPELEERGVECVLPLKLWLRDLHRCELSEEQARRFLQGQRLQLDEKYSGEASVFCHDMLLGNAELKPGMKKMVLHPLRILPSAQEYFL
ncbi:MAG TPA: tRNA pseudouridine(55) synthase TruB [Mariprofundaceae bacterium]|nr:tRNA pseudouridine(55) synthase TruB [Mariprofundaceae bacterium]